MNPGARARYASGVPEGKIIALNVDEIAPDVLDAAGLRSGQPVVAEAVDDGVLLRPACDAELAAVSGDADVTEHLREVARRYPGTLERLGT